MKLGSSHVLGIALADRTIAVAQVGGKSDGGQGSQAAIFTLPADVSIDKPEAVGNALAGFLKQKGFSASRVVVGVPAKWLMAVEKDVPPASRDQMRSMLRLQAERLSLADTGEVVFDFAGEHQANKPGNVLLVAMLKKQLDRVTKMAEAAGLSIVAVTPTTLALASVSSQANKASGNRPMVVLAGHGAEIVWQQQGMPRMLRHFSVPANGENGLSMGPLSAELRRAVALGPKTITSNGHAANGDDELLLWDSVGLASTQVAELSEKVGLKVKAGDSLKMLGVKVPVRTTGETGSPQEFASAVALALAGSERRLLPLNFVKSRLAPPPVRRVGRRGTYAIIGGALLLIALMAIYIDVNLHETTLAGIEEKRAAISKPYSEVQSVKDKVDFSDLYLKSRGSTLDVLREMTFAFGDDPQIWTTGFKVEDDKDVKDPKDLGRLRGTLQGKTTVPALANRLVSVLQQNPKFSNVNLTGVSGGSGNSRGRGEQTNTFSVEFVYSPNPAKTGAAK